jgi:phage baseplate assembly protein W
MNVTLYSGMSFEDGTFNLQGGTNKQLSADKVKEDIKIMLTQEKGKFYPDPEFGSSLQKFMFEPMTEILAKEIQTEITEQIEKYYPQITLITVDVSMGLDNKVEIVIAYSYSDSTQEEDRIKLELFNKVD